MFFFIPSGGSVVHFNDAYNTDYGNVSVGVDDKNNLKFGLIGDETYSN